MITQECLRRLISYCPHTGLFIWKTTGKGRSLDRTCGHVWTNRENGKNYHKIKVCRKEYFAHRLAFLYMTGCFPDGEVDHKDGNGLNNKWDNLRDVTTQENGKNRRLNARNKSGHLGVRWEPDRNKYRATIRVDKHLVYLGQFSDLESAIAVRKAAEIQYGFHENHGTRRPL